MTTPSRLKPLRLLAIVLSLTLVAAACGGDDDASTDQPETAPSPTAADTAETVEEPAETAAAEPADG